MKNSRNFHQINGGLSTWYWVPGTEYQVLKSTYWVPGTEYLVLSTWYRYSVPQYLVLGYSVPGTQYPGLVDPIVENNLILHSWSTNSMQFKCKKERIYALKWVFLEYLSISWVEILSRNEIVFFCAFFYVFLKILFRSVQPLFWQKNGQISLFFPHILQFLRKYKIFQKRLKWLSRIRPPPAFEVEISVVFFPKKRPQQAKSDFLPPPPEINAEM